MTMRLCSVRSAVLRPSLRLSLASPQPMNSLRGLSFCAANEWIDGSTLFPSLHLPSFLPLLLPAQRCENQITPFWLLISFTREEAVHGKEGEKGKGIGEEQHVQHQQMAYCISINMFQLLQNKKIRQPRLFTLLVYLGGRKLNRSSVVVEVSLSVSPSFSRGRTLFVFSLSTGEIMGPERNEEPQSCRRDSGGRS